MEFPAMETLKDASASAIAEDRSEAENLSI
jgi:hypothetical protein